nr:hypothetical protein [Marinilabilia salmonicolor]
MTETIRRTPEQAAQLNLWIDESGRPLEKGQNDVVFLYASVTDANGTILPEAFNNVTYSVEGDAELIGANPVSAEAGIATILLKAGDQGGVITIKASANGLAADPLTIEVP